MHKWSGWPGAYCLKCGSEDVMEIAIAEGWYDPYTEKWDTLEHEAEAKQAFECPVTDLQWAEHLEKTGQLHLWKGMQQLLKNLKEDLDDDRPGK
jgi:hypothetical protein